ncbi:MAG TPA: YihY/virulence factor BrkB family protein [Frankiaceae bacterium]|nr:YihY/virulence factor BrkB family protein [Frankiaceae bacterium]
MLKPMVRRHRRMYTMATLRRTLVRAWRDRVLGLAAEAGFWQLLSLPLMLLAVLGTVGYFAGLTGHSAVDSIERSILQAAGHLLNHSTVEKTVKPTIDDILRKGRPDVISIGFIASLWGGSSAMATYVNTITIAYGERHERGAVKSRLLALRLYLLQVLSAVILLPALVLGPTALDRLLAKHTTPWVHHAVTLIYWPIAGVLTLIILATLYHLSVPHRRRWRSALPGAVFALIIWYLGSWGLRTYVKFLFSRTIAYGALAAPVAVLLFLYVTALAVLLGAELNATLDLSREELDREDAAHAAVLGSAVGASAAAGAIGMREEPIPKSAAAVRFDKAAGQPGHVPPSAPG